MSKPSDGAKKLIGDFSPKLVEPTDRVLFDDVWERTELSKRDRSLITVAALIALNRPDQLRFHLGRAVENGVKPEELVEAITHLAFYAVGLMQLQPCCWQRNSSRKSRKSRFHWLWAGQGCQRLKKLPDCTWRGE